MKRFQYTKEYAQIHPKSRLANRFRCLSAKRGGDDLTIARLGEKTLLVYDHKEQNELLHRGKPCVYTDSRVEEDLGGDVFIRAKKGKGRLKEAYRLLKQIVGLKKGDVVTAESYFCINHPEINVDLDISHTAIKDDKQPVHLRRDCPRISRRFDSDERGNSLIDFFRQKGFTVFVDPNMHWTGMNVDGGQTATAYGLNKKGEKIRVGFSSNNKSFKGTGMGHKEVLYELDRRFGKWKNAQDCPKDLTDEEIFDVITNYVEREESFDDEWDDM
jgi:hypothetical protein